MTRDAPAASSLRILVLAVMSLVAVVASLFLLLATEEPAALVHWTAGELAKLDRPQPSTDLAAYNECVSRALAQRAKGCAPGDDACRKQSMLDCKKPRELQLMSEGQIASALSAGSQAQQPMRAMLMQRQLIAQGQIAQSALGHAVSLGLALLLALAAAASALPLSRRGGDPDRRLRLAAAVLAGVALAAAVTGITAGVELAAPGWSDPVLASSATMVKAGMGAAGLFVFAALAAAFYTRKASQSRD